MSKRGKTDTQLDRRDFVKMAAAGSLACMFPAGLSAEGIGSEVSEGQFDEMTVGNMQALMDAGKLTSKILVSYYINRIKRIDKQGPALKSVIEINPDALLIAEKMDNERKKTGKRSMMHGIPVLLKGNIDTGDRMETTAGSIAMAGNIAEKDAFVVKKLRESGAVILGKTNLSEWANFRSTRSSSGWSSIGGQTKNPYVLDRNPCGSSSGSGVAVSANLCAVAVGTETDGSVVCPSNANGIVGIKPTIGLISRSGIIPIAHSQDTAGPMGRTVSDAVHLLDAMTGEDSQDFSTMAFNTSGKKKYSAFLKKDALKGARIGVVRNYFGFHERVDRVLEATIDKMKTAGAVIVDDVELEHSGEYGQEEFEVLLYEFKTELNAYLSKAGGKVKSLKELIEYNLKHKKTAMPFFEQEILEMAEKKGPLTEKKYLDALKKCKELSGVKGIDAALKKHNLSALVMPTGGPAWKTDLITGDHFLGGSSEPAAVAGYPNITVPAGFVSGLPVGLSFVGTAFSEPVLIGLTYSYEQLIQARKAPEFRQTDV